MAIRIDKNFGSRECPSCGLSVEANHNRCPVCGYDFPALPAGKKNTMMLVAVILIVVLFGSWVLRLW